MNNIKKNRSKVTGVTVNLVDPNGNPRTVKIDPTVIKAIFWDDKCVLEILAPFYEKQNTEMTSQELSSSFGTVVGKKVAGSQKKVKLTKDVIKKLWEEEDDNGNLPALLAKTLLCPVDLPGGIG